MDETSSHPKHVHAEARIAKNIDEAGIIDLAKTSGRNR
jgi:hypothetical protein